MSGRPAGPRRSGDQAGSNLREVRAPVGCIPMLQNPPSETAIVLGQTFILRRRAGVPTKAAPVKVACSAGYLMISAVVLPTSVLALESSSAVNRRKSPIPMS